MRALAALSVALAPAIAVASCSGTSGSVLAGRPTPAADGEVEGGADATTLHDANPQTSDGHANAIADDAQAGESGGDVDAVASGREADAGTSGGAADAGASERDADAGRSSGDADAATTKDSGYDGGPVVCGTMTCASGEICVFDQQEGGAFRPPDDAGNCPDGEVLTGISCSPAPSYRCVAFPTACSSGGLSCACAGTLCQNSYSCMSVTGGVVGCYLLAP